MRYPESVKNALTPRKPPRAPASCAWKQTTATTASPRIPSNAPTRAGRSDPAPIWCSTPRGPLARPDRSDWHKRHADETPSPRDLSAV